MTSPPPEFSRMVAVERIDRRGLTRDIEANEAERVALARRFDLISIESFRASVRLRAVNGGTAIRLDGHVDAAVTQRCVVTLGPGYIDTPLTRRNTYSMPFLMSAEAFAERAFTDIARGVSYRVIPWQMGVVAKLLRMLPNALFDRLLSGRARKARQGEG